MASSDLVAALVEESSAAPECFTALSDLSRAIWAFSPASLALSSREPIILPDNWFVLTRQTSSNASDPTSNNVDRLDSRFLASSFPPVNQVVNSATYSPNQPAVTRAEMKKPR